MDAADRNWKSALSRFTAMVRSLGRRYGPRVCAEQVKTVHVGDAVAPEINLTDLAVVELVHDLRNQLLVMSLCVNAIRDSVAQGRADRLAELHRSVERAVLLINALLIDERPRASARPLADVNDVVLRTTAMLSHFQDDAIHIRLDLWAEPLRVPAEPGALERVLLNLVLNAYDAMPDGGVLTIETAVADGRRATIEGIPPGPYARLTIADTGCGMSAEVKDRIFDAFFTTKPNGTGLGLRSVAFTIQQLQGRISVDSEPGRGTSVIVMLPLATDVSVLNFPAAGDPHDSRD